MANTYVKIASATVGAGGASSIDFTSIPGTYTDLCIKLSSRNSVTNGGLSVRLNNDTGGNYSFICLYGAGGSGTGSFNQSTFSGYNTFVFAYTEPSNFTSDTFANSEIYLPNYAGSTNKSLSVDSVAEDNSSTAYESMTGGLWSNTSAITAIKLLPDPQGVSGNFVQYSTATLYGISKS